MRCCIDASLHLFHAGILHVCNTVGSHPAETNGISRARAFLKNTQPGRSANWKNPNIEVKQNQTTTDHKCASPKCTCPAGSDPKESCWNLLAPVCRSSVVCFVRGNTTRDAFKDCDGVEPAHKSAAVSARDCAAQFSAPPRRETQAIRPRSRVSGTR